jgi:hypothetical protein
MVAAFTNFKCEAVLLELEDSNGSFENNDERVAKSGEEYQVKVKTKGGRNIDNCIFKFGEKTIRIGERSKKYLGAGFSKGECGISFDAVNSTLNGTIIIALTYPDLEEATIATFVLLVVTPITELQLEINKDVLEQGDNLKVSCRAIGASPEPTLKIYFGKSTFSLRTTFCHYFLFFFDLQDNLNCQKKRQTPQRQASWFHLKMTRKR